MEVGTATNTGGSTVEVGTVVSEPGSTDVGAGLAAAQVSLAVIDDQVSPADWVEPMAAIGETAAADDGGGITGSTADEYTADTAGLE